MEREKLKFDFKLTKPIIFFDLETTGTDVVKDKIVAIACTKFNPDLTTVDKSALINPDREIPQEAIDIHHITNEMVANLPKFAARANGLYDFFKGCDLGGYNNNHFDNAMLAEEFARCGILYPEPSTKSIDVGVIFKKFEQRTLSAAMKFYCGVEDFESVAHDAAEDTRATLRVFIAMIQKYPELQDKDTNFLNDYCRLKEGQLDFQCKLYRNPDGFICFNFGAEKGKRVIDAKSFANWVLEKDFTFQTKLWIRKALEEGVNGGIKPTLFSQP